MSDRAIVRTSRVVYVARVVALAASLAVMAVAAFAAQKSLALDVVDAWHGGLIGGAKVQLIDKAGKMQFEGVTDKNGRLEAGGVAPGRYTLVITARGCNRYERKDFAIPTQGVFEADVTPSQDDD
jgi:hypothetical protein